VLGEAQSVPGEGDALHGGPTPHPTDEGKVASDSSTAAEGCLRREVIAADPDPKPGGQMFTQFNTGIPDMKSLIEVSGIGLATFVKHFEDGRVRVYVGGKAFDVGGDTRWRYVRKP
jgi:hypothetical protein